MHAQRDVVLPIPSVCPSVCPTPVLMMCLDEWTNGNKQKISVHKIA